MSKRFLSLSLALITTAVLVGCGDNSPCGSESQIFGITFANNTYNLKVNEPSTITSSIMPESCRTSVTLGIYAGALPTGMTFVNGNITGTPTVAETKVVSVSIEAVEGYSASTGKPHSAGFTIIVAP